ncbi:MAG TPA: hypothetical protein VF278_01595 [Pirellulales bacterium]
MCELLLLLSSHWKELARQQRRRVKELEGEVEKLKSFTAAVATAGGR